MQVPQQKMKLNSDELIPGKICRGFIKLLMVEFQTHQIKIIRNKTCACA